MAKPAFPPASRPSSRAVWRDLDTALLRSFVTLANTGSFTRTAEMVGRTQPAVTLQIRRLEALLGQPLFARSHRNVAVTTAGEMLLPYARQVLELLDQAAERIAAPRQRGDLRFGSPEDFATFFLPDILARFMSSHPEVRLRTNCELTMHLVKGLRRGGYDLVVIKQELDALVPGARPIRRERLEWVAAAEGGTPPARGAEVRLVLSPEPCVYRRRAIQALEAAGWRWSVVYTSPSLAGAAAAVRAGMGLTVLPRTLVPAGLAPLTGRTGLPALRETAICLLLRDKAPPAAEVLARTIEQHLAH
ncbi:MAG: LysR family transcriptional regulator [Acetobacteraceae bacterium]|nr:LysR family transcriptional regulator [Acetobacteraceae bacterium]